MKRSQLQRMAGDPWIRSSATTTAKFLAQRPHQIPSSCDWQFWLISETGYPSTALKIDRKTGDDPQTMANSRLSSVLMIVMRTIYSYRCIGLESSYLFHAPSRYTVPTATPPNLRSIALACLISIAPFGILYLQLPSLSNLSALTLNCPASLYRHRPAAGDPFRPLTPSSPRLNPHCHGEHHKAGGGPQPEPIRVSRAGHLELVLPPGLAPRE